MRFRCVRVTVFYGPDSTLQVEAGSSRDQVDNPNERFFISPEERDPVPIVIEALRKLQAALKAPKGNGIDFETTGRFLVRTPEAAALPVDLNLATDVELATLPGVGPETARRMIAKRPFASIEDLLTVAGIGEAKLAAIRDRVTVG